MARISFVESLADFEAQSAFCLLFQEILLSPLCFVVGHGKPDGPRIHVRLWPDWIYMAANHAFPEGSL